jgi:23S rRNA pseudouridine1911/1915/1917 synthase
MAPGSLSLCYEDDDLIAADKPAGMHTAPLSSGDTDNLLALLIARFPEIGRLPGIKPVEPGLLHRLDRETSGIVVAARTASSFQRLRDQFESGSVRKEYIAVCAAARADREPGVRLVIQSRFTPLGPGRKRVRALFPADNDKTRAREATSDSYTTEVEVERRQGDMVLVRARITKGFRHQIRVHLFSLGLPILGDRLYGVPVPDGAAQRMHLHAVMIALAHPADGRPLTIRSSLPTEFARIFPS